MQEALRCRRRFDAGGIDAQDKGDRPLRDSPAAMQRGMVCGRMFADAYIR